MGKSQNQTIELAYRVLEDFGVLTDDCHEEFGDSNIKIHGIKGIMDPANRNYKKMKSANCLNVHNEFVLIGCWTISKTPSREHTEESMRTALRQYIGSKTHQRFAPWLLSKKRLQPAVDIKEVPRELEGPIQKFIVKLQGFCFAEMCIEATDKEMALKFANDRLADINTAVNWRTQIESVKPGEVCVMDNEEQLDGETKGNFFTVKPDRDFLNRHYTTTYTKRKENI